MNKIATEITADARKPKRARGRQRVESLLTAAAEIIARHGYTGATMTEIAREAGAPIGSLYQFFPRKSCLAKELVSRFRQHIEQSLNELTEQAAELNADELARQLLAVMASLETERRCVGELLQAEDTPDECQNKLRQTLRLGVQNALQAFAPLLDTEDARIKSIVVANLMKSTIWLEDEKEPELAQAEWANMMTIYLNALH